MPLRASCGTAYSVRATSSSFTERHRRSIQMLSRAACAIHTDANTRSVKELRVVRAGNMAALIAVPNLWWSLGKRTMHRIQNEGLLQRVVQGPVHHRATCEVKHRHQIHPSCYQADRGASDRPNLIGRYTGQLPHEVWIHAVCGVASATMGTGMDAHTAHLAHMPLHRFASDKETIIPFSHDRHAPRSIDWMRGVEVVKRVRDRDRFSRWRHRRIGAAAPTQRAQLGLLGQREDGILALHQRLAFIACQSRGQIFSTSRRGS